MKIKELVDKLLEMDSELDVYVPNGSDMYGPTYVRAETVGIANEVTYVYTNPDSPWVATPAVIEVVRIGWYR